MLDNEVSLHLPDLPVIAGYVIGQFENCFVFGCYSKMLAYRAAPFGVDAGNLKTFGRPPKGGWTLGIGMP